MIVPIAILFIVLVYFVVTRYQESQKVLSTFDNNYYIIRSNNNPQESANTLAEINQRVMKLIAHLRQKYNENDRSYHFVRILSERYNHQVLSEAAYDTRYTTYTIDKEEMHVCLRTRDHRQQIYDTNLLMYVVLHELAHLCNFDLQGNPIEGHGMEFSIIFRLLVQEAINIGVYRYQDYSERPVEYCGMTIHTSIV